MKVIIDGSRYVAMRTIDDVLRPDRDGCKERMRRSVGAAGGRVVHQIESPSDIAFAQIAQLV